MKHTLLVASLALSLLARGAEAPSPLSSVVRSLVTSNWVGGAVALVADRDKVLEVDVAGCSSLRTHEPMREDNLFWIASMTKSFTGAALMLLADEGKVNLSDPVEKYLPEFKGQLIAATNGAPAHAPQHPITIREIMSHTSGLLLANDPTLKRTSSLQSNVLLYAAAPLRHEPGAHFHYNNTGINTAGRIIEAISGLPYADFMQQRLFAPLGLQDTTFWPTEQQAKRLARSSRFTADKHALEDLQLDRNIHESLFQKLGHGIRPPAAMLDEFGISAISNYGDRYAEPAGGLFSTARDVGRFCQMLLNGGVCDGKRILSAAAVKQISAIQTGDVPVNPQEAYGVGWFVKIRADEGPAIGSYGHRGARKTVMWIDPAHNLVMVLLVQRWDMPGEVTKPLYTTFLKAAVEHYGRPR